MKLILDLFILKTFKIFKAFAFFNTDISKAFVSCMLGVEYVGYWFVVFGISAATFSFIIGFISKYVTRIPLIIIALFLSAGLNVFLLFWQTNGEQYIILYSLAIFYGIFQAIISTQMNSMIGVLYFKNSRPAFSVNRLCSSLSGAIGFSYSGYLCVRIKCYIIIVTSITAFIFYSILEIKILKDVKDKNNSNFIRNK